MTAATPVEFEPAPAIRAAGEAIREEADAARRKVDEEVDLAAAVANAYGIALANGEDPLTYSTSQVGRRGGWENVSPFVGLTIVYRAWNAERGAPHEILPWPSQAKWVVAERMTETLGVPVSYADLTEAWSTIGGRQRAYSKPSSDTVAGAVLDVEKASDGKLVARRTRVDGKVAFLVRERRPSDPEAGTYRVGGIPEETV